MVNYSGEEIIPGFVSQFCGFSPNLLSCGAYLYGMELNQKINIRITEDQLKRLKLAVAREKMTMSEIIRRILQQYIQDNPKSVISKNIAGKAT